MSIQTLYKFKSLSTTEELKHARSLIHDSEIYFSSPLDFNDPFECRPRFRIGKTEKDKEDYFRNKLNVEPTPEVMDKIDYSRVRENNLKKLKELRVGMCCFSKTKYEILMYSHYASAHQGFCLEFEVPNEDSFFGRIRKVDYSNEYPIVDLTESDEDQMERTFLYKSKKWKYEKEWRMFAVDIANTVQTFTEELLKGVIFGCKMDEDYKILFREWAKKRSSPLQFYEARIKGKEYGLDIVPVD